MQHLVAAALVDDGRVLLAHRSPSRTWYPDVWDLPGGHVEAGEQHESALARELDEELGITVDDTDMHPIADLRPPTGQYRLTIFRVDRWRGRPVNACPAEHDRVDWLTADDLVGLELAHPLYRDLLGGLLA